MVRTQHLIVVSVVVLYCIRCQLGVEGIIMAGNWFKVHIKCKKHAVKQQKSEKVRANRPNIKNMQRMVEMLKVLPPYKISSHNKKLRKWWRAPRVG